ncbi:MULTISPECIES: CD3324 family protein [Paenibacillus]|uniref:CD3324 family protein n=1 Tax=Paenibacillus TaxID=44249 RepID=UPI001B871BBA|nr:CD3324 family protein [Paenibacillus anaericanus]
MIVNYKNGKDVLPPRLLKELQHYIQGELLYIPKPEQTRAPWGELSGSRTSIALRNKEIFIQYSAGRSAKNLAEDFYLSEESIRKVLSKMRLLRQEASSVTK